MQAVFTFKNTTIVRALLLLLLMGFGSFNQSFSLTFSIPEGADVVGATHTTTVRAGESLGDIGRRFDVGVCEMIEANPELDPWVPTNGAVVLVPTQFVLPKGPRVGIVLNLAEMRLYYFHPDKRQVTTHPVGLGKKGEEWITPLGQTVIIGKKKNPDWHPPDSIRREHLEKGDILPPVVPGGPDNPLGQHALYLDGKGLSSKGSFLIHGTNHIGGVGVRSSHGCIRLLPADIATLFDTVPIGTPVRIIHEPFKVGWLNEHLYLEVHQPLTESKYLGSNSIANLEKAIDTAVKEANIARWGVNWAGVELAAKAANGYPVRID